ncbi:hypothetical protein QSV34_14590 [Porticoccus sp. W117]|uniref:hypothetical protein n=1 Tax=Porticoccus sp. W117 TaxID=3054777 RepID=UPI0025966384|nr:hypothetical protein [Porticoccus sp. W117]MDM3872578.1 hypothetical protein [Porticoccus sp. W117]
MTTVTIPILENPNSGPSLFTEQTLSLEDYNGLIISPRIDALNFRHRVSEPGYFSDWHVAGDPTLIVIRQGMLRIGLRDGSYRDFSAGDVFIAKDRLSDSEVFDEQRHGHTAQVAGTKTLLALHIKLESL